MEKLESENPDVRKQAAYDLGVVGPDARDAIPALIKALGDENAIVGGVAYSALVKIGPAAIPLLVDAMDDPNAAIRNGVVRTLDCFDKEAEIAVPRLIRALKEPDRFDIKYIMFALGDIGHPAKEAIPVLEEMLISENQPAEIKINAADTIYDITGEVDKAVPSIMSFLTDDNNEVRVMAIQVLGSIGADAKAALQELREIVEHDTNSDVREAAKVAIQRITKRSR
jgi:HEAT repeat protein